MNETKRDDWMKLAGIALVVIGGMLLLDKLVLPLVPALGRMLHVLLGAGWAMAFIALGVVLIVRAKGETNGRPLYRSRTDRMVGGVLAGIAARMGVDSTIVRVVFVVLALMTSGFVAVLLYVVALVVVPEEPVAGIASAPFVPTPPAPAQPGVPVAAPVPPAPSAPPVPPMPGTGDAPSA